MKSTAGQAPTNQHRAISPRRPAAADAGQTGSIAFEENVQAIKSWERAILLGRSKTEQISDWIASTVTSASVLLIHLV